MKAAIERLWRTGEIFLSCPDVTSEIRNVLHYFEKVFPDVVELLDLRFQKSWQVSFSSVPPRLPRLGFGPPCLVVHEHVACRASFSSQRKYV
jgi:phosphoenolpyruvate carboxylase